ncbi:MAG: UDP-N-acetylmuramate:L-alanyl-gamma-D-glutamyl-meso-diaminopimelate ligase [Betaproteobacteria bacterium]|nr:UDP-N-acetylmuramate:L-alanyl-gamma-D-glutamyl-meso-diaminopimelate ligase [Betaproteobacteria bacterium]
MHIHILGICGTFMGGIAAVARAAGHTVTGCDANVYPPMSTQLEALGIQLIEGFGVEQLELEPDIWVVGNVMTRGKQPIMEEILNRGLPYVSGPQWLAENVLHDKWVLAVAGTHGKTTTASMLAWILEDCGLSPGYLIGGVPMNFEVSARLTESPFFVIEADEYDTAFFDKRSKFVHYRPRTCVLNNLEYDHADIFPDLTAIETQFHHLIRTVPGNGLIVANGREASLDRVLARGCWTPVERFGFLPPSPSGGGAGGEGATVMEPPTRNPPSLPHPGPPPEGEGERRWRARAVNESAFEVYLGDALQGRVAWELLGEHNTQNALAAIAAARHSGVPAKDAIAALGRFRNVKRRMEVKGAARGVTVYDDFAHHPTAIATTVAGLRSKVGEQRILAVLEPRSNTMKLGVMKAQLPGSLAGADRVFCYTGGIDWDAAAALAPLGAKTSAHADLDALVEAIAAAARPGDQVLVMSNGGFGGIHDRLLERLGRP